MDAPKPRRRHQSTDTPSAPASSPPAEAEAVHIIHPTAIYDRESLRRIFKLKANTIRREVKLGRLRVCRRGGRYYFTGEQVWAWLLAGEQKTPQLTKPETQAASA
jgi:hypothetical protein